MTEDLSLAQWTRIVHERGQCERCPATEYLHAHHKDRDKANNTLDNGECLCRDCHAEEHSGESGFGVAADYNTAEQRAKASVQARLNAEAKRGTPLTEDHKARVSQSMKTSKKVKAHVKRLWEPGGALYERQRIRQEA
jgi:hypothetical protein